MATASHVLPPADCSPRVLRIAAARPRTREWLGELWAHRELLAFFVWRDVKVRYKQTLLGVAWAALQPLATMIVFSVIFGRIVGLDSDGLPYPVFSLAGVLPWLLFAGGLTLAANCLVGNVNLLTKVYFPRLLLPLANVATCLLDCGVSLTLLLGVMGWYGVAPSWRLAIVPLALLLALTTSLGAGLWLAALHVQYRDVRYAMPFVLQIWMYSTPIVYSLNLIEPGWRAVYALNPLVGAVTMFRWSVGAGGPLSLAVPLVSTGAAVALLAGGVGYFRAMERTFADRV